MKKCPSIQEANVSLFFFVEITFLWMEIKHLSKIIPSDILYTACINPDCSNLMAKRKERYSCFVNCDVDKDFKFYFLILHKLFRFLVWGLFNFNWFFGMFWISEHLWKKLFYDFIISESFHYLLRCPRPSLWFDVQRKGRFLKSARHFTYRASS